MFCPEHPLFYLVQLYKEINPLGGLDMIDPPWKFTGKMTS